MKTMLHTITALIVLAVCQTAQAASAVGTYYIGLDNADTITYQGSDYVGMANPNKGRLSMLLAHGNHYHGIGTYDYTGPANAAVVTDTNGNNRLPETYTTLPPVSLKPGSGAFLGKFRSGLESDLPQDVAYGDFKIQNVHSLSGVDDVLYNSSGNRWNALFASAHIHISLLSATDGLNIALGNTPTQSLTVGGDAHLGDGFENFEFLPTFWVDGDAAIGSTYTAEFMLNDVSGNFEDSGRFFVDVQVVPEPLSCALLAVGGGAVMMRRKRQRII